MRTLSQNNGFRMSGTLFVQTTIPTVVSEDNDKAEAKLKAQLAKYRDLMDRLNQAPGIVSASLSQTRPLGEASYL